jgi:hypothetical protein
LRFGDVRRLSLISRIEQFYERPPDGALAHIVGAQRLAHGEQLPAQGLLGDPHPERVPSPLAEVHETPAYDPVDGRGRAGLDQIGQYLPVLVGQSGRRAGSLAVDPAGGSMGVGLRHHPIAHDLHGHAADPGRCAARRSFVDRGNRQKPPRLRAILRSFGHKAAHIRVEIRSHCNRHGELPSVRHP